MLNSTQIIHFVIGDWQSIHHLLTWFQLFHFDFSEGNEQNTANSNWYEKARVKYSLGWLMDCKNEAVY